MEFEEILKSADEILNKLMLMSYDYIKSQGGWIGMPEDYLESTEPIYTIVMPSNWDDCYHEIAIDSLRINECNEIQITGFDYTTCTLISAESTMDNFIDIASFCNLHQKMMKTFG